MEIKGYTYGFYGSRGQYRSEKGIRSQELLYRTGINWLCLAVVNNRRPHTALPSTLSSDEAAPTEILWQRWSVHITMGLRFV